MTPTTIVAFAMTVCLALGAGAGWRLRGAVDEQHQQSTSQQP